MSYNHHRRLPSSSWPHLPSELLLNITEKLPSSSDISNLRAVCKKWRSSVPPPPLRLHPNLPHSFITLRDSTRVILTSTAVFLLRPRNNLATTNPWLVAVEQLTPNKLRLCHPLTKIPQNVPKYFPNNLFTSLQLSKGFSLKWVRDSGVGDLKNKVLLYPYNFTRYVTNDVLVLLHGNDVSLSTPPRRYPHDSSKGYANLEDVIYWQDMFLGVDSDGKLYAIESRYLEVSAILVENPPFGVGGGRSFGKEYMRLLLESEDDDGDIYLIRQVADTEYPENNLVNRQPRFKFKVYKHDRLNYVWKDVADIGDRILFISIDTCFFVKAKDFLPGFTGNCLVFHKNCLTLRVPERASIVDFEIGFCYIDQDSEFKPISECPGFSEVLGTPTSWIWENKEHEKEKSKSNCRHVSFAFEMESPVSKNDQDQTNLTTPLVTPVAKEPQEPQEQVPVRLETSITDTVQDAGAHVTQRSEIVRGTEMEKFEGVRPDLVPVLEIIWGRYGNITAGSSLRSNRYLVFALECLAEVVNTLKSCSARTITDAQCEDLMNMMSDLKNHSFKLDWLTPFVDKAVALHRESYQLVRDQTELDSSITRTAERKMQLAAELASLDTLEAELKVNRNVISRRIMDLDLDRCLAEGLF